MSKKSFLSWLEWHEKDLRGEINWVVEPDDELGIPSRRPAAKADKAPLQVMAPPEDLFERLYKSKSRLEHGCGQILVVSLEQKRSFKLINGLRRDFVHFTPKGWSIELGGLPRACLNLLAVLRAIAADDWPFRHLATDKRTSLIAHINMAEQLLQNTGGSA